MNLLEEIQKAIAKARTPDQAERLAVEYIAKLDMKNPDTRQQAVERCKQILSVVEDNREISSLDAKTLHSLITKIHLSDIGLDIPFRYISRDEAVKKHNVSTTTLGFYTPSSDSITFIDETVYGFLTTRALTEEFRDKSNPNKPQTEGIKLTKFNSIAEQIQTICHECQHAIQKRTFEGLQLDQMTTDGYIIDKQNATRECYLTATSKYGKNEIYWDNHDEFYNELDADEKGYEQSLGLLRELSPSIYQTAVERFGFEKLRQTCKEKKRSYEEVTWSHKTNPNNAPVSASHKASMIIDTILPQLSSSRRKDIFKEIPSLYITYNSDGSKKSLAQVEREREANINRLLVMGTPEEIKVKVPRIIRTYETAIESDPVLSFERCMKQIAELSWDGTRHYSRGGESLEEKYDHAKVIAELKAATEKAGELASYIEDCDYKIVKQAFAKCKRDLEISKKTDQRSWRFYNEKRRAMYGIESEIMKNRDFKIVKERDEREAAKKRMNEMQAEEIIKKVFPNFTPQNIIFEDVANGSLFKEADNVEQKLLLIESYKKYVQDCAKYRQTKHKLPQVSSQDLLAAIHNFYNFQYSDLQKQEFERKLKNGEIEILKNVYTDDGYLDRKQELLPHATKKVEPVTQEEIKQVKEQPTSAPQQAPQTRKQEEKEEFDEYGVRIPPKETQPTTRANDQAVRSAQEQQEEHVRQQGYERSM